MSVQSISERIIPIVFNKYIAISVGSVIAVIGIVKIYKKRQRYLRRKAYPRDLVILHQYPRGLQVPSASPYVLKLETWLRMADIKYQNEFGFEFGPKGKLPFITYNGEDLGDSDLIIQYLSKMYGKDLSKDFSLSDQGIARAFSKMVEESLIWVMVLQRLVYAPDPILTGIPYLVLLYFGRLVRNRSKAQGYGLHSQEEVYSIGRKDIKSINDFLDGKQFLLGDRPCNEDAALFGTICQILYVEDGPMNKLIKGECPNILSYVDRIKSTYWPDWNQCITSKKSKKNE